MIVLLVSTKPAVQVFFIELNSVTIDALSIHYPYTIYALSIQLTRPVTRPKITIQINK
jgi:hypothetical protein